jgi:uncharacterized protein
LTRVFFDANVIIAGASSNRGEAHVIIRLAEGRQDIGLLATEYTIDEAERTLQRKQSEALPRFYEIRECLEVHPEPSLGLVKHLDLFLPRKKRLPKKDLPVLAGAISAGADWLITHDREHFGPLYGDTVEGVEILRPVTAIARLDQLTRSSP